MTPRTPHTLVVDANIVVDLCLERRGMSTTARADLEALMQAIDIPMELDGLYRLPTIVVSRHILEQAKRALATKHRFEEADAVQAVTHAARWLLRNNGILDKTVEDYPVLSRRCWYRRGTDTEDEAVLACAERHHAGIVTRDKEFISYLHHDRHWPVWSLADFAAKVRSQRR